MVTGGHVGLDGLVVHPFSATYRLVIYRSGSRQQFLYKPDGYDDLLQNVNIFFDNWECVAMVITEDS